MNSGRVVRTLSFLLIPTSLAGQTDSTWMAGTERVVPGPHYDAGWLHRFFFGDHYRELWTRELVVPVLKLSDFEGGIIPICRGGGYQTMSLRLRNDTGAEFVFRSVDKDPTAKLPVMLRETFVADVLQDQISSHHPAGALVVPSLLEATGVLHATPRLALMPNDQALGQFQAGYAGLLGLIEERPEEGPNGGPGFAGSGDISGTDDVWDDIEDSPADRVDALGFLRARLMDIFVGDWDRHYDQWRWARFPDADGFTWRPIPRDRDQAFSRLDGVILDIARLYIPELVSFRGEYGSIFGLTWTGRALDRRFLVGLSRSDWDSVVIEVQKHLTDRIIADAVRRLPREIYATEGPMLTAALQQRREGLREAADEFYEILAAYVDVHVTDQDELAEIDRIDDDSVRMRVYLRRDDQGPERTPHFDRTFSDVESREVRLYLHGGDDVAVLRGTGASRVLVRIIGGGGDDTFVDSSRTGGDVRTKFYDARGANSFERGLAASFDRRRFRPPEVAAEERGPFPAGACGDSTPEAVPQDLALPFRDWGGRWAMLPWTSYQPHLGWFFGGVAQRIAYGFRRVPFKSLQTYKFGYASGAGRFRAEYEGDFRGILDDAGARIRFRYSGIEKIRFHGFGNETEINQPDAFFDVSLQELTVEPGLMWHFSPVLSVGVAVHFKYAKTALGNGNLVDTDRPRGSQPLSQIGAQVSFLLDTRDDKAATHRGVYLSFDAFGYRGANTPDIEYTGVSVEARTYLTAVAFPLRPTLALRVGGKRLWGRYPYYDAAYLSGAENLRGFAEQRFAGDAAVFGNAELRLFLTRYRILLPGEFGIFGLADVGRVFLEAESSSRWHAGGGGGIWFAFVDRAATLSLALAQSREQRGFYMRMGFPF